MKLSNFSFFILIAASGCAAAQQAGGTPGSTGTARQTPGAGWALGLGAAVSSGIYAGEGTRVTPFPLVSYQGERFFWRGIGGGAHLLKRDGLSIDATLSARMDGIERDDFGMAELAERGIERALLADRDNGLDLGLATRWRGAMGLLELELKGDVSGASKGAEAGLKYAYPMQWGGARVSPHIGVSHYSKKLANYYYGTLAEEIARGVADYTPGGATVPRIGVDLVRPFAQRWVLIGNVSYKKLPRKLSDSPLLDKDTDGAVSAFFGVSRGF